MPASDDLKFNVVDSTLTPPLERWVRGTDITFGSATAQGLLKVGNITIDAEDPTASSVDMGNTAGPGFTANVHGDCVIDNNLTVEVDASLKGYAFCNSLVAKYDAISGDGFLFDGAPTAARTITLPDASGTAVLQDVSGDINVTRYVICDTPYMRGATGADNMRFKTSLVTGSRVVVIPSKSGTMAVGTTAPAIPDLVVGVATVNDCATAINAILAVLRGFEQVTP